MSNVRTSKSVLFGARDLAPDPLLAELRALLTADELALEWKPGCRDAGLEAAWFALEGAGAWIIAKDLHAGRKLAMRLCDRLHRSLDYYEGSFASSSRTALVEQFECTDRMLNPKARDEVEGHDGNTLLIALDGAKLLHLPVLRGGALDLYFVDTHPEDAPAEVSSPITALRPNLEELWGALSEGIGHLRRTGPGEYRLVVQALWPGMDGARITAPAKLAVGMSAELDAAEVAFITGELTRRGLPPLRAPALDSRRGNELLRWVAAAPVVRPPPKARAKRR